LEDTDLAARVEEVLRLAAFRPVTVLELCAHAGVEADAMAALLDQLRERERWTTIGGTDVAVVPEAMDDLGRRLSHWLGRYHKENTDSPGRPVESVLHWLERLTSKTLARPLFDEMVRRQTVKLVGRFVALPAFAPTLTASDERKLSALIEAIRAGGFQPPSIEELAGPVAADRKRSERLATLAVTMGELVPIAPPIYLHADAERQLREKVAGLIGQQGGVTVAAVREALDSSRKFVVPFLEYLDRVGFTRRVGDLRYLADRGHGRPIGR
jgi:selenocysteine-specific elongation factor